MAGRKIANIRLSEARELYLADMRSLGRAENTIGTAKAVLAALERVVGNKVVRNIDKKDINDYYTARVADGSLQQSTLNLHTTRLRLFFQWSVEEAYIDEVSRPMRGRGQVKVAPKQRSRVTQDQFADLLDAAKNPRDRIVVALGLYTMLRASEIRSLRRQDVSMEDQTILVTRHKTREVDTLPIGAELHDELANYFAWASNFVGRPWGPEWFVAPGNKRRVALYSYVTHQLEARPQSEMILTPEKAMWENGYGMIVHYCLKAIGWQVTLGEGVHTLRRSAARELFESLRDEGYDSALLTVMSWLGHKQPLVTMRYLGLEREADRRNRKYKGALMFPKAVRTIPGNVVSLRAVE